MIKYFLVIVIILILVVHYLTPSWMISDFTEMVDWIMIFFLGINCAVLFKHKHSLNRKLLVFCMILGILFILTVTYQSEENSTAFIRLLELVKIDYAPASETIDFMDFLNLISTLIFLVLEMIVIVKGIRYFTSLNYRKFSEA
jgi:hypothetical protein